VLDVTEPDKAPPNLEPGDVPNPDPPPRLPMVPLDGESGPGIGAPTAYNPPFPVPGGSSAASVSQQRPGVPRHQDLSDIMDKLPLGKYDRRGESWRNAFSS
jgi:hypothetical protein